MTYTRKIRKTRKSVSRKKQRSRKRKNVVRRRKPRTLKKYNKRGGFFNKLRNMMKKSTKTPCDELNDLRREASEYTKKYGFDSKAVSYNNKIRRNSRIHKC